ncbi:MAG: hypothetical protein D6812_01685 [Deltaproteobacteria bacterium]|nr:MAG: hypothetical protein D6812_01685 [Deltaproteobacteria bacterium]
MTSATTAVGFASLTVSEIVPIREFGYFAAFGVAAAFVIAIVLTPIALSFLRRIEVRQQRRKASLQGLLAWIAEVNERHPGKVAGISGILCLLAAFGIPRIAVETNFLEFFKKDDPAVFQVRFIEEHLTAIDILKIVLDGGEPGAFKEPERLAFLEALRAFLEAQPEITRTIAIPDFLKKVNQAFHDGDPQAYRLPETRQAVSQYLLLFEGDDRAEEELARLINFDRSRVRVTALVKMIGSRDQEALLGRIASWMKAHCPPGIHFDFSGAVKISATVMNSVVNAQIESFALALVMITGMMILMLRSWKLGLVSMIPNVLPILLTLGLMGWAAIPLNIATAMTASIAIGLAVDDTIHFLSRYQIERKRLGDPRAAIRTTLLSVGPALITTSVVLFFGFFISIFSSTRPSIHFAILAAVTIVTALLADLFLTPVCLLHLRRGRSLDAQSKGSRSRSQT